MDLREELNEQLTAGDPAQHRVVQDVPLEPEDELVLRHHKRIFVHHATRPEGAAELVLYYGNQEISFDEPELFEFGETLPAHGVVSRLWRSLTRRNPVSTT